MLNVLFGVALYYVTYRRILDYRWSPVAFHKRLELIYPKDKNIQNKYKTIDIGTHVSFIFSLLIFKWWRLVTENLFQRNVYFITYYIYISVTRLANTSRYFIQMILWYYVTTKGLNLQSWNWNILVYDLHCILEGVGDM